MKLRTARTVNTLVPLGFLAAFALFVAVTTAYIVQKHKIKATTVYTNLVMDLDLKYPLPFTNPPSNPVIIEPTLREWKFFKLGVFSGAMTHIKRLNYTNPVEYISNVLAVVNEGGQIKIVEPTPERRE